MHNRNMLFINGYLGKKPELKQYQNGQGVYASLSIGCSRNSKQPNGTYQTVTDWFYVTVHDKTAQYVCDNTDKGTFVDVQGALRPVSVDNGKGGSFTRYDIYAKSVQVPNPVKTAYAQQQYPPQDYQAPPQGYQPPPPQGNPPPARNYQPPPVQGNSQPAENYTPPPPQTLR